MPTQVARLAVVVQSPLTSQAKLSICAPVADLSRTLTGDIRAKELMAEVRSSLTALTASIANTVAPGRSRLQLSNARSLALPWPLKPPADTATGLAMPVVFQGVWPMVRMISGSACRIL